VTKVFAALATRFKRSNAATGFVLDLGFGTLLVP
jgi:hypothetical protein